MKFLFFYDESYDPITGDLNNDANNIATSLIVDQFKKKTGRDVEYEITYSFPFGKRRDYDVLYFDYGGLGSMCTSLLNSMVREFVKDVINNPSRYYVLNSTYCKYAVQDVIDEFEESPSNLFLSTEDFVEYMCRG